MRERADTVAQFVLANREELLALAGLVVLVGFLGGGWLYANPDTSIEKRSVDEMTVQLNVSTGATVTGATPLYETGATVRNMPLYLRSAMPENRIDATVSFDGANRTNLTQRIYIRYTGSRSGKVFWSDRRQLATERATVEGGGYTTTTTVDMSRVARRLDEIRDEVGRQATVKATLVVETSYRTMAYNGTVTRSLPVTFTDKTYTVGSGTASTRQSHARTTTVERSEHSALTWLLVVLGLFGLGGTGAVVAADRAYADDFAEWEFTLREYDDWISRGAIEDVTASTHMEVATLVDLVDVAIESDSRVIYDPRQRGAVVVANDVVYHWSAPGVPPLDPQLSRPD